MKTGYSSEPIVKMLREAEAKIATDTTVEAVGPIPRRIFAGGVGPVGPNRGPARASPPSCGSYGSLPARGLRPPCDPGRLPPRSRVGETKSPCQEGPYVSFTRWKLPNNSHNLGATTSVAYSLSANNRAFPPISLLKPGSASKVERLLNHSSSSRARKPLTPCRMMSAFTPTGDATLGIPTAMYWIILKPHLPRSHWVSLNGMMPTSNP